jgi:hypothetical protein
MLKHFTKVIFYVPCTSNKEINITFALVIVPDQLLSRLSQNHVFDFVKLINNEVEKSI